MVKTCRGSVVDYSGLWDLGFSGTVFQTYSVQQNSRRTVFQPYSVSSSVGLVSSQFQFNRYLISVSGSSRCYRLSVARGRLACVTNNVIGALLRLVCLGILLGL